jgi:hypothetical protein
MNTDIEISPMAWLEAGIHDLSEAHREKYYFWPMIPGEEDQRERLRQGVRDAEQRLRDLFANSLGPRP